MLSVGLVVKAYTAWPQIQAINKSNLAILHMKFYFGLFCECSLMNKAQWRL